MALALALLGPSLAGGVAAAWVAVDGYRSAAEGRLRDTARALSLALDAEIDSVTAALVALAESPDLRPDGNLAAFEVQARAVGSALGTAVLARGPGPDFPPLVNTLVPPGKAIPPTSAELLDILRNVAASGRPHATDLFFSPSAGRDMVAVVMPLAPGGAVRLLGMALPPERFARLLAAQRLEGSGIASLADGRGRIIARSDDHDRHLGQPAPYRAGEQVETAAAGLVRAANLEGTETLFALAQLRRAPEWTVAVSVPWQAYGMAWRRSLLWLAAGAVAVLVLGLGTALLLARRVVRPLDALARRAQAVASGTALTQSPAEAPVAIAEVAELRAWMAAAEKALLRRTEAVAAQKERLEDLTRTLDLGMAMVRDMSGCIRFWSRGCERLYGWSAEEAVGRHAHDLLRTTFPVPPAEIEAALERDGEWTGDLRHRTKDGRDVVVTVRKALRRDQEGQPVAVLEAVADVTAARRVEAALRDSEATLRAVLDALPVGVAIADASGRILHDNAAHRELWGMPPETTNWEQYRLWIGYRPGTGERIKAQEWAMARALLKGETTRGELVECARFGTGERRFFLNSAAPVRDAGGRIVAGVIAEVDVTDHRKAQAALAESEARLRSVVDTAADGILVADAAGRIVSANASAMRIFGYDTPEDLLGRDLGVLMPRAEAAEHGAHLARHKAGGRPRVIGVPGRELTGTRRDGTEFPIELSVSSFTSGGERFFTGVVRDITERRRAEELRALLTREVDHRAKNALAVALSLLRLTPREDAARFAASVEGRVTAMARAHSLLATQKWEGADLHTIIEAELAAHAERVSLAGPAVRLAPEAVQPVAMLLHELATNAAKYGALKHEEGRILLSWNLSAGGDGVVMRWEERGGSPVQAPVRRGFGSRLLATLAGQQLGGSIAFDWAEAGVTCTIRIAARFVTTSSRSSMPATVREAIAERRPRPAGCGEAGRPAAAPAGDRRPRILVVEDEALLALETEGVLEDLGCEVVGPARTLAEAVRLAAGEPDLSAAVLDVNLGNGEFSFPAVDLLQTRGVPYVFATGYGSARSLNGRGHGAVAVLVKPYPREALADALSTALRKGSAEQEAS